MARVCEVCGKVVGFVKLVEFNISAVRYGCILWIAVHPEFRRCGLALELTRASVEFFRSRRSHAIFASTQLRNIGAQASLTCAGFERVGFVDLWRRFGWCVFGFYAAIWYAPGEVVFLRCMDW